MTDIVEVVVITTGDVQGLINSIIGSNQRLSPEDSESFNSVNWDDPFWDDYHSQVLAKIDSLEKVSQWEKLRDIPPAHFFQFLRAWIQIEQESVSPVELIRISQTVKEQDATKIYVKIAIDEVVFNDFTRVTNDKILQGFTCHIVEE